MPFEINNLKIGFTTKFYKKKNKNKKKNYKFINKLKKKKKLRAPTLAPFSWLKVVAKGEHLALEHLKRLCGASPCSGAWVIAQLAFDYTSSILLFN